MSDDALTLRERAPNAWAFHRASSRWAFNQLTPGIDETPEGGKEYPNAPFIRLPEPGEVGMSISDAIDRRASSRDFAPDALNPQELSTVLHHAIGILGQTLLGHLELARRPAPSPGGMYPLELYLIARNVAGVDPGTYHFQPVGHGLEQVRDAIPPPALHGYLFMNQPYVVEASVTLVMTAVFERSLKKYGDRGYRYALIEAGHVAQNISLVCAALGLAGCPLGGFFDIEVAQLLKLDIARELPIYAFALGKSHSR
jgi:SagB-type dehydrogenase family enzyme